MEPDQRELILTILGRADTLTLATMRRQLSSFPISDGCCWPSPAMAVGARAVLGRRPAPGLDG